MNDIVGRPEGSGGHDPYASRRSLLRFQQAVREHLAGQPDGRAVRAAGQRLQWVLSETVNEVAEAHRGAVR